MAPCLGDTAVLDSAAQIRARLRLELQFEFGSIFLEGAGALFGERATPGDCARLLYNVQGLLEAVDRVEESIRTKPLSSDSDSELIERLGALSVRGRFQPSSVVQSLRYGSPLWLNILLAASTPPSLGLLIFGAKRLFGVDLEFRAHRERMGAEYEESRARHLQAKRIADALAAAPLLPWPQLHPSDSGQATPHPELRWSAKYGRVVDDQLVE
jgi:hypothetical protein